MMTKQEGEDVRQALRLQPTRGALGAPVPTDPTIYRFYEVVAVCGPTIKDPRGVRRRHHERHQLPVRRAARARPGG